MTDFVMTPEPCPFCGERLVLKNDHHGQWWAHKNEPGKCHASTDQLFEGADIVAWNTRAARPADQELGELERKIAVNMSKYELAAWEHHGWIDTSEFRPDTPMAISSARYLELRGMLERHPTEANLVRVK